MCKYLLYRFDWHIFYAPDRSWKDSISKLLGTLVLSDQLVRFKTQFHFLYSNYSLAFATLDTHSQISSAWLDGNRTTFFRPTCSNARNLISTWQRKFHDELFIIRLLTIFNSSHRFASFDWLPVDVHANFRIFVNATEATESKQRFVRFGMIILRFAYFIFTYRSFKFLTNAQKSTAR